VRAHEALELRRHAHQHRGGGSFPDRQVRHLVAGIGKGLADGALYHAPLVVPLEVVAAVAGQHLLEQAQVRSDAAGDALVRSGGQGERAAPGLFRAQVAEQRLVVGQAGGVEIPARILGQQLLEPGAAFQ
jgi:hypothetical protein